MTVFWSFLSLKLALLFDTKISKLYCGNLGAEGLGGRRVNWPLLWICDLAFTCKILECFVLSALSVFKLVLLCFLAIHKTWLGYDPLRVCPKIVTMNTAMQPTFILEFLHHVLRADMVKKLAHQPARVRGVTFMLQILSGSHWFESIILTLTHKTYITSDMTGDDRGELMIIDTCIISKIQ